MPPLPRRCTISYLPSRTVPVTRASKPTAPRSREATILRLPQADSLVPQEGQKRLPGASFWPQLKQKAGVAAPVLPAEVAAPAEPPSAAGAGGGGGGGPAA